MQFLRRHCRFHNMRQKIETYIKKCSNCQKNKHSIHKKYEKISISDTAERIMKRNNDEFYYEIIAFNEFNNKKKLQRDISHD